MYLFFDTETTGLPRNWNAPVTDTRNWPRMVQIAWRRYDAEGGLSTAADYIIKPEGYVIPKEATLLHGISHERAMEVGASLKTVLTEFSEAVRQEAILVAHNISFDEKIVGAEFVRMNQKNHLSGKVTICTMLETTNFCKIPGKYGFKWPKLSELYFKVFGEFFDEAHDASVDIEMTAKCFWELKRRGVL
jgi:DNA polymerase III epsilon subunit-like protein